MIYLYGPLLTNSFAPEFSRFIGVQRGQQFGGDAGASAERQLEQDSGEKLTIYVVVQAWRTIPFLLSQGEIQKNYEQLQRSISQEFQKKMHLWETQRHRAGFGGGGAVGGPGLGGMSQGPAGVGEGGFIPGSPTGINEANLKPEFRRKYDAWQRKAGAVGGVSVPGGHSSRPDDLGLGERSNRRDDSAEKKVNLKCVRVLYAIFKMLTVVFRSEPGRWNRSK